MNQELKNMLTMIGCEKNLYLDIIKKAEGKIIMSSGSYYADFTLFDSIGLLANFSHDGKLKHSRV